MPSGNPGPAFKQKSTDAGWTFCPVNVFLRTNVQKEKKFNAVRSSLPSRGTNSTTVGKKYEKVECMYIALEN
jgi:hypothetical protein